jgi:predicted ATPase with chaperone activity
MRCNAEMTAKVLRESCPLDAACEAYLKHIVEERRSMSARSIDRLIKCARTVADLLGQDLIDEAALEEAARYRAVDPTSDICLPENSGDETPPTADALAAASDTLPLLPPPP